MDTQPLIYISLGTVFNQAVDFYKLCFAAFAETKYTVVLSIGRQTKLEELGDVPANFIVRNYIPQLEVLQRAKLFITHGGMNSTSEGVKFYTPVNEIFICAKFSALIGFWNERLRSEAAFVTALKHCCRANLLAIEAILKVQSEAWFIQSESAEYFHEGCQDPDIVAKASFENQRRFLPFDLLYSHPVRPDIRNYLQDCGLSEAEYNWFMNQNLSDWIIMGNDFYERNEQIFLPHDRVDPAGDVFGWYIITRQYYDRYQRPIMHTETNNIGSGEKEAVRWLWKQFFNVRLMQAEGILVVGFTWFSLIDQMDWDVALLYERNVVNPIGLFDMDRRPRPVALAYRQLIKDFTPILAG